MVPFVLQLHQPLNSRQPKQARANAVGQSVSRPGRAFQPTANNVPKIPPPVPVRVDINNTYNPSKLDTSKSAKRMVIIDGSNVAFS